MASYFFCGIGGSGMLPLALICKGQGHVIAGSDRSHDMGRLPEKFLYLTQQGISIVPQDGWGLTSAYDALIVSSAIEDTIPEVKRAKELGVPIVKRAELLARLFNGAERGIAVGGTSGKSTTTGMLAWILSESGHNPTVMNGANFLNFMTPDSPYATALVGDPDVFVSECDESDGSIVMYHPSVAILTNVALDHKPIDDLLPIFNQYLSQSKQVILNITNNAVRDAFSQVYRDRAVFVGIDTDNADIVARQVTPTAHGISCDINVLESGEGARLDLIVPGRHNVENALCAIAAARLLGVPFDKIIESLTRFEGVQRRLQTIGTYNNISVIDDFAHNPDKINASLKTLKEHKGRLLVMFQMHGYGPLRLMKNELLQAFADHLGADDLFFMPDVLYLGGTVVDMSYSATNFVEDLRNMGVNAHFMAERSSIMAELKQKAVAGDRIVIMGARDDTLTECAQSLLA